MLSTSHCQILKLKGRKNADISRSTLFWFTENLQQQKTLNHVELVQDVNSVSMESSDSV